MVKAYVTRDTFISGDPAFQGEIKDLDVTTFRVLRRAHAAREATQREILANQKPAQESQPSHQTRRTTRTPKQESE